MPKEPPPEVAGLGAVQTVPIDSVRAAPDNPRKISPRAVEVTAGSIRTFGWQQPLVVDADGVLIVGHTRHRAAKHLGLTEVPVTVAAHLTPEQVRAYRIADNRTGDYTTWDFPELTVQLEQLADGFSDVLALADWQSIVADYDALVTAEPLTVAPEVITYVDSQKHHAVLVVCETEAVARQVAAAVVDLDGVLDVRDKRT